MAQDCAEFLKSTTVVGFTLLGTIAGGYYKRDDV